MLGNIAFRGIYAINFPESYGKERVKAENRKLNAFIKANNLERVVKAGMEPGHDFVIGVNTNVDSPQLHYMLFNLISPKVAKDYINKTQINLYV